MSALSDQAKLISRKTTEQIISRRLSYADVLECALKTWTGEAQVAKSVAANTWAIVCEAYESSPAFLGNKSKKWILGGLFYQLGLECEHPKTQKQIARILGTNEVTIRDSYHAWLRNFPKFWTRQKEK